MHPALEMGSPMLRDFGDYDLLEENDRGPTPSLNSAADPRRKETG